jgi:hypothetical protein
MISTVTTSTISTVTTTALSGTLTLIAVIVLFTLLVKREIINTTSYPWAKRLQEILNIAIIPLFVVFGVSLAVKVGEMLF